MSYEILSSVRRDAAVPGVADWCWYVAGCAQCTAHSHLLSALCTLYIVMRGGTTLSYEATSLKGIILNSLKDIAFWRAGNWKYEIIEGKMKSSWQGINVMIPSLFDS